MKRIAALLLALALLLSGVALAEDAWTCPICQAQNTEDTKVCSACGLSAEQLYASYEHYLQLAEGDWQQAAAWMFYEAMGENDDFDTRFAQVNYLVAGWWAAEGENVRAMQGYYYAGDWADAKTKLAEMQAKVYDQGLDYIAAHRLNEAAQCFAAIEETGGYQQSAQLLEKVQRVWMKADSLVWGVYVTDGSRLYDSVTNAPRVPELAQGFYYAPALVVTNRLQTKAELPMTCEVDGGQVRTWETVTLDPGAQAVYLLAEGELSFGQHTLVYKSGGETVYTAAFELVSPQAEAPALMVNGRTFSAAEVNAQTESYLSNAQRYYASYGYDYDIQDENTRREARQMVIDGLVEQAVLQDMIAAYGCDRLSQAELDEIDETLASYWDLLVTIGYSGDYERLSGEAQEQYKQELLMTMFGTDRDSMILERQTANLKSLLTADVTVTEAQVREEYQQRVREEVSRFVLEPSEFGRADVMGKTCYYTPAGYRRVKSVMIGISSEDSAEIRRLRSEGRTDEADALGTRASELLAPRADEVLARLAEGEDWDSVMAAYTEDPGMQGDTRSARLGYAVCEGYTDFVMEFVQTAMDLEHVGDWSDKTWCEDYGYFIIYYASDIEEGQTPFEEVRGELEQEGLERARNAAYDRCVAVYRDAADVQISDENSLIPAAEVHYFDEYLCIDYAVTPGTDGVGIVLDDVAQMLAKRLESLGTPYDHCKTVVADNETIRVMVPRAVGQTFDDIQPVMIKALETNGALEFRAPDGSVLLNGSHLAYAAAGFNSATASYTVTMTLTDEGRELFREATQTYLGQSVSIWVGDDMLVNAIVQSVIPDGQIMLNGSYSSDDVRVLAARLMSSGSFRMTRVSVSTEPVNGSPAHVLLPVK